jgi:S1-C subfamily serine protease
MSEPTLPDRPDPTKRQDWIARLVPIIFATTLTLGLPALLTKITVIPDLSAVPEQKLREQIRSISIKVLAHGKTIGSGVIFGRRDRVYTVITNAHVIQSTSAPFQLQTPDGQVYAAALIAPPIGKTRDLSVLRFQSQGRIYPTAKLAPTHPKIGDRVWSSGFPLTDRPETAKMPLKGLTIADGQITQILATAITGGYAIGCDNEVRKGMSGGPLVDRSGELVGINGVHADPLWEVAETLEDGSAVSETLQEQINNFSWAIPLEFVKDYAGSVAGAGG